MNGFGRDGSTSQRMAANPAQPWLWRQDWSERRALETAGKAQIFSFIFALAWCAITLPMAFAAAQRFPRDPQAGVSFVFAAIGLVLLGAAMYSALRRRKFGRSVCEIDRVPIEPGQRLNGTIVYRSSQVPEGGYRLTLSCINRILTGGGKSRSVTNDVLWSSEQTVSGALVAPSPAAARARWPATSSRAAMRRRWRRSCGWR